MQREFHAYGRSDEPSDRCGVVLRCSERTTSNPAPRVLQPVEAPSKGRLQLSKGSEILRIRTRLAVTAVAVLTCALTAGVALADSVGPITFEPPMYVVGDIDGQDGWSSTGPYDHMVSTQSQYPSFGTQSLRISNVSRAAASVTRPSRSSSSTRRARRARRETARPALASAPSRRSGGLPRPCRRPNSRACKWWQAPTVVTAPG